jgi:HlyD family secretion protein
MMRLKKVVLVTSLVAAAAVTALLVRQFAFAQAAPSFRFTIVERRDIQAVVSATGTLDAVTTVSVGTQVSGQVSELLVDFNDRVKKGQLLARIDQTIALQGVADAQANLERLQAQANQATRDQNRSVELSDAGLVAPSELEQGGAALQVAAASEKSGRIALRRAQQNLSFTSIYAPIDGVVVERNVSTGQTVAASLSAPQLFLIANDLTRMQILAQVGESDIDRIKQGQSVTFTVQALPGQTFTGTVAQVRLQSKTVDNVVNYTVVVTLANPDGKLLPGMTARVDFLVASAVDVLTAPNAALRYRPSDAVLKEFGAAAKPKEETRTSASREDPVGGDSKGARENQGRGRRSGAGIGFGTLYHLDSDGKLAMDRVRLGISDGAATEVEGKSLSEGMKVIDGMVSTATASPQPATNPMSGTTQGGGGRSRGGAF